MIYICYKCKACKREFVLLVEDVHLMVKGRYLRCPYCSSKRVDTEKIADAVRDCMNERSYSRNKRGAIEQRRFTK